MSPPFLPLNNNDLPPKSSSSSFCNDLSLLSRTLSCPLQAHQTYKGKKKKIVEITKVE
jgi:hypothetical protein